jgi:hypothetical protein
MWGIANLGIPIQTQKPNLRSWPMHLNCYAMLMFPVLLIFNHISAIETLSTAVTGCELGDGHSVPSRVIFFITALKRLLSFLPYGNQNSFRGL